MGKRQFQNFGFTLLDVLFAIAIIIIVLITILGLLYYVILAGRLSNDRFIAANLAQEGVEVVRAIRDSNWKAGATNWKEKIDLYGDFNPHIYEVQYDDDTLVGKELAGGVGAARYLKVDLVSPTSPYNYTSGQDTKFKRIIYIQRFDDSEIDNVEDEPIRVVSEVIWQAFGKTYQVIIEDRLYNWY